MILQAREIFKSFNKKEILNNISFDILDVKREGFEQGQIVSLIGKSGIGKSVLLKILCGLMQPDFGEVLAIDNDSDTMSPVKAGNIGVVTQHYVLFNHRTVKKNLLLANPDIKLVEDYCLRFDLFKHLDKYPHQLSGGQKQRVSIIQQILAGNKIILLDEPFSGLDTLMIDKILKLLSDISLQHELNTLLIVSHDLESSLCISDTAFIMAKPDESKGATIIKKYDLIEEDLCYKKNIREIPRFREIIHEIKEIL